MKKEKALIILKKEIEKGIKSGTSNKTITQIIDEVDKENQLINPKS